MLSAALPERPRDWLHQELRALRMRHGAYSLPDRELARQADVHVEQVRRWLYGDHLPSRAYQADFARLLAAIGASEQEQRSILQRLGFEPHPEPPRPLSPLTLGSIEADNVVLFDLESPRTGLWEIAAWAGAHRFRTVIHARRQTSRSPALSCNGRLLVTFEERPTGATRLEIWGSVGKRLALERPAPLAGASRGAWSPDGRSIACQVATDPIGRTSAIVRYDLASDRAAWLTPGDEADAAPCWRPDGTSLAFVRDGALWAVDADGRRAWLLLDRAWNGGGRLLAPAMSPDGARLAFVQRRDRFTAALCCLDLRTGRAETLVGSPWVRNLDPCWSPDSERLLYASNAAGQYHELWLCAADGSGAQQATDYRGNVARPTWQRAARQRDQRQDWGLPVQ